MPEHWTVDILAIFISDARTEALYAITHASAALVLKRKYPRVGLWPLLISVQLVELLWIVFTYLGIEHFRATPNAIHLDFLTYSHSVFTGALLAVLAWGMGKAAHRSNLGVAIGLGIFSHIVLDIIPMILPTVILVQVVATWLFVWWFGRRTIYLGDTSPGMLSGSFRQEL